MFAEQKKTQLIVFCSCIHSLCRIIPSIWEAKGWGSLMRTRRSYCWGSYLKEGSYPHKEQDTYLTASRAFYTLANRTSRNLAHALRRSLNIAKPPWSILANLGLPQRAQKIFVTMAIFGGPMPESDNLRVWKFHLIQKPVVQILKWWFVIMLTLSRVRPRWRVKPTKAGDYFLFSRMHGTEFSQRNLI